MYFEPREMIDSNTDGTIWLSDVWEMPNLTPTSFWKVLAAENPSMTKPGYAPE